MYWAYALARGIHLSEEMNPCVLLVGLLGDVLWRMVLLKLPGRDVVVAYLPNNDAIEVTTLSFSGPVLARWLGPVRSRYMD